MGVVITSIKLFFSHDFATHFCFTRACFLWGYVVHTQGDTGRTCKLHTGKALFVNPTFMGVGADDAECGTRRQRPHLPQAGIEPGTL